MKAYKFLRADGSAMFTGHAWRLGEWQEAPVDPCRSGIHACRVRDMPYWVGPALFECELDGPITEEEFKVVAPRGRLVRRLSAWEEGVREEYAGMCAERAREIAQRDGLGEDWTVVIGPLTPSAGGIGFVAARLAEVGGGTEAYLAERERQAEWLAGRLGLS